MSVLIVYAFLLVFFEALSYVSFRRMQVANVVPARLQPTLAVGMAVLGASPLFTADLITVLGKTWANVLFQCSIIWMAFLTMHLLCSLAAKVVGFGLSLVLSPSGRFRDGWFGRPAGDQGHPASFPAPESGTASPLTHLPWFALTAQGEGRLALVLAVLLIGYGFIDAANPRLETLRIASAKIPPGQRVRVALIADLHLSHLGSRFRLGTVLPLVASAQPDLLISAGDFVDTYVEEEASLIEMLQAIQPPLGKLAILGNHENIGNLEYMLGFHKRAGFTVLRQEKVAVTPFLTISGCDDPIFQSHTAADVVNLLSGIPSSTFVMHLHHPPKIASGTRDLFDLQLSGHMHHGQIFPIILFMQAEYGFTSGLTRLGERGSLYVSRGSGTNGPPIRIFAPPEVTIIDLVPADAGPGGKPLGL